jgi:hypothetical protein
MGEDHSRVEPFFESCRRSETYSESEEFMAAKI